jgi:hypothetical protein
MGSLLTWGQTGLTGAEGGLARLLVKQGVEEVGDGSVRGVHGQAARGAAAVGVVVAPAGCGAAHAGRAEHAPLWGLEHTFRALRVA